MRYFYEVSGPIPEERHCYDYFCDHQVYSSCTIFLYGRFGLGVVQQYYDPETKSTTWSAIDPRIAEDIYNHDGFVELLLKRAGPKKGKFYPVMTVRKVMWELRMKPLKKEPWETTFDRRYI